MFANTDEEHKKVNVKIFKFHNEERKRDKQLLFEFEKLMIEPIFLPEMLIGRGSCSVIDSSAQIYM